MTNRTVQKRVDALFESSASTTPELLAAFVKELYESYSQSEKALQRSFVYVFSAWAIFYAIAEGLVSEASVSSVKVSDLKYITLLSPVVLAYLVYNLSAINFLANIQHAAYNHCMSKLLPGAYEQDLEQILGPPTFLKAERLVLRGESRLQSSVGEITQILIVLLFLIGTFAAVGHSAWLAWNLPTLPWYLRASSISIAVVIWLRSALFWARSSQN